MEEQPTPEQPKEEKSEEAEEKQEETPQVETIPKKVAAREFYIVTKQNGILGLAIIIGVLVVAFASQWYYGAAAGAALIFAIFGAIFAFKAKKRMAQLKNDYKL